MSDNAIRHTLVTRFFCASCGSPLNISYDPAPNAYMAGDETGAALRYNAIAIEPCRGCVDRELKPARELASAIKALSR